MRTWHWRDWLQRNNTRPRNPKSPLSTVSPFWPRRIVDCISFFFRGPTGAPPVVSRGSVVTVSYDDNNKKCAYIHFTKRLINPTVPRMSRVVLMMAPAREWEREREIETKDRLFFLNKRLRFQKTRHSTQLAPFRWNDLVNEDESVLWPKTRRRSFNLSCRRGQAVSSSENWAKSLLWISAALLFEGKKWKNTKGIPFN